MKYIVIIPDGMADYPCEGLFGKTPLDVAKTPNMDALCKEGEAGLVWTVPHNMQPASDVANLCILGYNPQQYYTGRGPLEAVNLGVKLDEDEIAFRCNLVTVDKEADILIDYSAGHISNAEAKALISKLNEKLANQFVRFHSGVSYRHLVVIKGNKKLLGLKTVPPHNIINQRFSENLPLGEGAELLRDITEKSYSILKNDEVNTVRIDLGENPANMIWLWGQGKRLELPCFKERFGIKGAVISAVDLIKGIGKIIGFKVIEVKGATGYYDTNYDSKGKQAINALKDQDFVYVHIESPDEAGHNGDLREKIKAIEEIDHFVVAKAREYIRDNSARVLILPDHFTPVELRRHCSDPVPFLISGKGISPGEIGLFSEAAVSKSKLRIKQGWKLMEHFLR